MKKLPIPRFGDSGELKKMLLRMKLSSCLLLLTFLHVSAHVRSQDKLTLNVRSIGWQSFFDLLQTKSNYTFLYKDNTLPRNQKFDVAVSELTVPQILDAVLHNSQLTYQVLPNHLIAITPRVAAETAAAETAAAADAAEDIRITGRIVSSSGEPLAGATVHVKGGTVTTITDSTGHFSLLAPDDAKIGRAHV